MADFQDAHEKVMKYEGGYSNHPNDYGGETYKGISRKYHPDWEGWLVIDEIKEKEVRDFEKELESNQELQNLVHTFYKKNYWDVFWGDYVQSQDISNELFDISVNLGDSKAIEFLQTAINQLNRNQKTYSDISVDGIMGIETFNALNTYLDVDSPHYLYNILNILQGHYYIQRMKEDDTQEAFARGWLSRVHIFK